LTPGYEQQTLPLDQGGGRWVLVASKEGRDGSVTVHQDIDIWTARFAPGEQASFQVKPGRQAWLQVVRGGAAFNGTVLRAGDGAAVSQEETLEFKAVEESELLLFDLGK
jgi:redox-sensitive bicupin YhaK (pirin superfamily)